MIAWVDVETTGLEPRGNALLEVGVVLTDDDLNEKERKSVLCELPPAWYLTTDRAVLEMHHESGLWEACAEEGLDRMDAMFELVRWLDKAVTEPPVMAGSTVGFDRACLKAQMPVFAELFHYRSIDVSSLKELNVRWGFAPEWEGGRKLHRSLPDIEDSIAELGYYRAALGA